MASQFIRLAISVLLGVQLFICVRSSSVGIAPTADDEISSLLRVYREAGLPLPGRDAELVQARFGTSTNWRPVVTYRLGFRTAGEIDGLVLCGVTLVPSGRIKWEGVLPKAVDAANVEISSREAVFPTDDALATAIQCEAVGMHDLAQSIIDQTPSVFWGRVKPSRMFAKSVAFGPPDLPVKDRVAYLGWAYWCDRLTEPDCDRSEAARRMEFLMGCEPALRADEGKVALLNSLKAALRPSHATPGSIESEIDHLVELSGEPVGGQDIFDGDREYAHLALRGFAAVPDLLKHVADDRLTRAFVGGINRMAVPRHQRVGELVSAIIANIAGDALSQAWLGHAHEFPPNHMATAEKWWADATKQGEEA